IPLGNVLPASDPALAIFSFFLRVSSHLSCYPCVAKIGDWPFALRAATGRSSSIDLLRHYSSTGPSSIGAGQQKTTDIQCPWQVSGLRDSSTAPRLGDAEARQRREIGRVCSLPADRLA